MQQPFTERVIWCFTRLYSKKCLYLLLEKKIIGKWRNILYESIWVGDLADVAVITRWFLLCRRHRGAYSNTWCPWQQNNIRRSWSNEPKQRDEWHAESFAGAQKIWFILSRNLVPSLRQRRARLRSCLACRPCEIRSVNLFFTFTLNHSDAWTINEA